MDKKVKISVYFGTETGNH